MIALMSHRLTKTAGLSNAHLSLLFSLLSCLMLNMAGSLDALRFGVECVG
jgi:hypothetical protein